MQFIINKDNLIKPLQHACASLASSPTMPILHNVLLKINDNTLTIIASDLEVEITTFAKIESASADLTFTIAAKKLLDICKSLPDGTSIKFEIEQDNVTIHADRSKFKLSILDHSTFPVLLDWEVQSSFSVAQKDLLDLINGVKFAMANQDSRYFLNGVKIEVEGKTLRLVATDGHRMAIRTKTFNNNLNDYELILPRKGVLELLKILSDSEDPVMVELGSSHVRFKLANIIFNSKLIDGRFPVYRRALPQNADKILIVDCQIFLSACRRASILIKDRSDKSKGVRVNIKQNQMLITASDSDLGNSEEIIDVDYNSEEIELGFNINYMIDVLDTLKTGNIKMNFSDSFGSFLIERIDTQDYQYIIMPMRL